jgi:hypothetical protein
MKDCVSFASGRVLFFLGVENRITRVVMIPSQEALFQSPIPT